MKTMSSTVLVLVGWVLTIALTYHLLSGTFDARTCQTTCVSTLYWVSLALAIGGVVTGLMGMGKGEGNGFGALILLLGLALLGILGGVMLVGVATT